MRRWISRALWALAILGALEGIAHFAVVYVNEIMFRQSPDISAPQLAAPCAEVLVVGVLPYVLARAWDEITRVT